MLSLPSSYHLTYPHLGYVGKDQLDPNKTPTPHPNAAGKAKKPSVHLTEKISIPEKYNTNIKLPTYRAGVQTVKRTKMDPEQKLAKKTQGKMKKINDKLLQKATAPSFPNIQDQMAGLDTVAHNATFVVLDCFPDGRKREDGAVLSSHDTRTPIIDESKREIVVVVLIVCRFLTFLFFSPTFLNEVRQVGSSRKQSAVSAYSLPWTQVAVSL